MNVYLKKMKRNNRNEFTYNICKSEMKKIYLNKKKKIFKQTETKYYLNK